MASVQTVEPEPTLPSLPARPTLLTVRHVSPAHWSVTSRDGRLGGTFMTQKAALHYAREERNSSGDPLDHEGLQRDSHPDDRLGGQLAAFDQAKECGGRKAMWLDIRHGGIPGRQRPAI